MYTHGYLAKVRFRELIREYVQNGIKGQKLQGLAKCRSDFPLPLNLILDNQIKFVCLESPTNRS